jgi:hypothetical protein
MYNEGMVLKISIDPNTEARLRKLANGAGKDIDAFVSDIVESAAARPFLDQMLAPLRAEFAASKTKDGQLIKEITTSQKYYRARLRKKKQA